MTLLDAHNVPFAAALLMMALLALVQVLGLGDWLGDSEIDADADGPLNGPADGLFTLLGIGRVPFAAWLALFLLIFAGLGVGLQEFARGLLGEPLDRWLAAAVAAGAAVPFTAVLARPIGRVLPRDETTAVTLDTLVGRRARITDGVARTGSAARARVHDVHGHPHHVMVEPHDAASELHAGDEVLLVRRDGQAFYATALVDRRLSLD